MNKFSLLVLFYIFSLSSFSQTTFSWRNDQNPTSGQWNVANYWWNGGGAALPGGSEILYLDGNIGTTMTNDLPSTNRYRIIFGSGGASRTINGTTENTFYDYSANKPKIENNSSNSQTIAFPIKWGYGTCELNPINGNLNITSTINNNGNWTDVWGSAGTSLTIAGGLSGSGGLTIKNNTSVFLTSACTYTGNTYIDYGNLEISADNTSSTIIVASGTTLKITGKDVDIQALTISSGGTVEIAAGKSLTVNGTFTNNGTLILKSDATGTATILTPEAIGGTGTYKVQQYLSSARNWYMSAPANANTPSGYIYYQYLEPGNNTGYVAPATEYWKDIAQGTAMGLMTGYIVQTSGSSTIEFSGTTLNNSNISKSDLTRTSGVNKSGFNLVGNPYPSFLNWTDATKTNLNQTMWYRTKEGSVYKFYTYSAQTNLGSPAAATRYIPPMQAFWIRVENGTGALAFTNSMRSHSATENLLKAPSLKNNDQKVLRIEISNGINTDEALILFNPNASDDFDIYDSPKMSNELETVPEIFTIAGNENVVINGLNNVSLNAEIPLGISTREPDTLEISTSELSNFDTDTKIVLKDKLLDSEQEISNGKTYRFWSDVSSTSNRFSIIFRSAGLATYIDDKDVSNKIIVYTNAHNQIIVKSNNTDVNYLIEIYNSFGQKLENILTSNTIQTIDKQFDAGIYFIKTTIKDKISLNKVVIR